MKEFAPIRRNFCNFRVEPLTGGLGEPDSKQVKVATKGVSVVKWWKKIYEVLWRTRGYIMKIRLYYFDPLNPTFI